MLLGDSDVEHAVGEPLGHAVQSGGSQHRSGDADQPFVSLGESNELIGEHIRPGGRRRRLERFPGLGIDLPDRVELVGGVAACRLVPAALVGDRVHDHGGTVVFRLAQRRLHGVLVMTVDRTDVLDLEIRVQRLVAGESAEESMQAATHAAVERTPGRAEAVERAAAREMQVAIGLLGAHGVQEPSHAADRRSIGAAVVVDDDDQLAGVVVGDVVERLPRHAARERAVADDGDDVSVGLAGHLERLRDAVGP